MYWLPIMHDNGLVGGMFKRKEPLPREEALQMLEIINRESKRINQPDAIPLEYKLAHIWDGEGQMMEAVPHD